MQCECGQKTIVDLTKLYDFRPVVIVEEFLEINKLAHKSQLIKLAKLYRQKDRIKADLMRGMIICDECGEPMSAGITSKKSKRGIVTKYFYYRCDTDDCDKYGKSVRAKVIMDYIYAFLDQKPFSSKTSYDHYVEEMKLIADERLLEAKKTLLAFKTQKRKLDEKLVQTKNMLISDEEDQIKNAYKGDLKQIQDGIRSMEGNIERQNELIARGKGGILTYVEFLELMEKTGKTMRKIKNMSELDYLCRKLFLNLTVKGKSVVKSTLSAPFDELYAAKMSECGR